MLHLRPNSNMITHTICAYACRRLFTVNGSVLFSWQVAVFTKSLTCSEKVHPTAIQARVTTMLMKRKRKKRGKRKNIIMTAVNTVRRDFVLHQTGESSRDLPSNLFAFTKSWSDWISFKQDHTRWRTLPWQLGLFALALGQGCTTMRFYSYVSTNTLLLLEDRHSNLPNPSC